MNRHGVTVFCPSSSPLPLRLQDLPPAWARLCLRIKRFIAHTVGDLQGSHVLLACSAGSDSLALLLAMHYLAPQMKIRIAAAHMDHCLRQESAWEAASLGRFCDQLGMRMFFGRSDVGLYAGKTGLGLEEAGRILRYRYLLGLSQKIDADMIMTAHHADDLAEDVLMRLLRGAGWPGLAGMPAWDHRRRLARPLLYIPKSALRDFLRALGVTWSEDPSNADLRFLRNRIRDAVLPEMQSAFPGMHRSIAQVHALGILDDDYFTTVLASLVAKARNQSHCLDRADLDSLHPALRLRLFKTMLDGLGPGQVRHEALFRLEKAWRGRRTGTVIQFPGGKTGTITPGGMLFAVAQAAAKKGGTAQ